MEIPQKVRDRFPALKDGRYVNTATSGLLSKGLLAWRKEHDLDYATSGSERKAQTGQLIFSVRQTVGECFGCTADNVALIPSFSLGINLLLEGLGKKEKIVLLEQDYPSLNRPFQNRDFKVELLPITANLEERIHEGIQASGATVLACSLVQWLNGIQLDVRFFKELKRDYPDLLIIVDGTQFCGTDFFDFSMSGIDVLGTSGYKWLLAGYGNGFFLVNETAKARFSLKAMGYGSGRNLKENSGERTFCKHLEPGHLDSLSFGSLDYALKSLMACDLTKIGAHNRQIAEKAKTYFTALGLLEDTVQKRKSHSTIFNITVDRITHEKLLKNNIVGARRGGGTRLGFHFYNTLEDLEAIITLLKS